MGQVETDRSTGTGTMREASNVASAKTQEAIEGGRGMITEQARQRSSQLADQMGTAAQTMRQVAEQSRTKGDARQARLAEQAAGQTERMSSYLQDVDPDRLLEDVEDFARRQPWVVAGAGLFLGFALARTLKASSQRRYAHTQPSRYHGNGRAAWSASPDVSRGLAAGSARFPNEPESGSWSR